VDREERQAVGNCDPAVNRLALWPTLGTLELVTASNYTASGCRGYPFWCRLASYAGC
jgi:hypothetical protein